MMVHLLRGILQYVYGFSVTEFEKSHNLAGKWGQKINASNVPNN